MVYYELSEQYKNNGHIQKEREKARKLKKTQWWLQKRNTGICHYCNRSTPINTLTMDHIVPIARGGRSSPGNVVPSCLECNQKKKLSIPVESLLQEKNFLIASE